MSLTNEYWPCPLCITTLLVAHTEGRIDHDEAYTALGNSGLVENWPDNLRLVRTTEKGKAFVEMILATPLPVNRWIDPREEVK